ncbi:hypothetical protein BD410DRAFT_791639 [Rickenella mellea]|uniref:Mixed lineage kinase domain-containing protein n=1 Tax=Rickenella mellea TaxID=50990 RepID=A0A4Y7PWJ2_9AGAM|nr:hypothetical protein BD410DRAFT_791639 [Rickenella mellea]
MVETNPRTSKGKQATKIDAVLSNASDTIALAKELAPLIPVPLLGSIFSSAQAIVDAARNVRKNKKDCAELARRVSDLTQDLAKEIHGREEAMDDRLKDSLVPLQRQLVEIQEFVERHTSRKIIMNFVNRGAISTQVTDLLMNLDYMMQRFKTTSNIRMEVQLAEMKGRLVALGEIGPHSKQIEWDGQYRVYRMAELRLLRVLRDLTSTVIKGHAEVSLVECHEAEIDGKTVVVKFYRGSPQVRGCGC